MKDVATDEFISGIALGGGAKRVTIEDSTIERTSPIDSSVGYPFQISAAGQQTLVQHCKTAGDDSFPYAAQARTPGPNVLLGLSAQGIGGTQSNRS